jgi:hypothetical protein
MKGCRSQGGPLNDCCYWKDLVGSYAAVTTRSLGKSSSTCSPRLVPRPAAPAPSGNLVEKQLLRLHSRPSESESALEQVLGKRKA